MDGARLRRGVTGLAAGMVLYVVLTLVNAALTGSSWPSTVDVAGGVLAFLLGLGVLAVLAHRGGP